MASDLETLTDKVRTFLKENGQSRFLLFSTTSNGASNGTTMISTSLYGADDVWNGCMVTLLDGTYAGLSKIVEDFTDSTDTLTFTNNPWPVQIVSGTACEIYESKIWSGREIRRMLVTAINFLAGALPKSVLNGYIRKETVGSVGGIADPPSNAIDIAHIYINGKPAIPVPPERADRLISGRDRYASPTTTNRYFYLFEGKTATAGQIRFFPATNVDVTYHKIPYMSNFETDGSTYFPDNLFDAVSLYATALLYQSNRDLDFASVFFERAYEHLKSRGIKVTRFAKAEYN